jgi:hypothetical protein
VAFGALGSPDHDECIRISHAALDQRIDEIVPSSTNVYDPDELDVPQGRPAPAVRRRPLAERGRIGLRHVTRDIYRCLAGSLENDIHPSRRLDGERQRSDPSQAD